VVVQNEENKTLFLFIIFEKRTTDLERKKSGNVDSQKNLENRKRVRDRLTANKEFMEKVKLEQAGKAKKKVINFVSGLSFFTFLSPSHL
jgi:hypothetical protein